MWGRLGRFDERPIFGIGHLPFCQISVLTLIILIPGRNKELIRRLAGAE
jgi:hypothetical protein